MKRSVLLCILLAACADPGGPAPITQEILFARDHGNNVEIYAMQADGSDVVRLTSHPGNDYCPRGAPDGQTIAFGSDRGSQGRAGTQQIYVMDANGSDQVRLTTGSAPAECPDWSPDGSKILFSRLDPAIGFYAVFVMNADGSDVVRLTSNPWDDFAPRWSPDGRQIACLNNRPPDHWWKPFIMNADGSDERPVPGACEFNAGDPRWSPDGSRIAFTCDGSFGSEIHVARMDGTGRTRLSAPVGPEAFGYDSSPVWSPDGQRLAISRNSGGNLDVYSIPVTGGAAVRLTSAPEHEFPADWRRRP